MKELVLSLPSQRVPRQLLEGNYYKAKGAKKLTCQVSELSMRPKSIECQAARG